MIKIKGTKKYYKNLYETELNNRKLFEKRYKELKEENIELQKLTRIADFRKKIQELNEENEILKDKIRILKEDRANLYIQREDLLNEKEMIKITEVKEDER